MKVQHLSVELQKGLDSGTITGEQHHDRFAKKRAAMLLDELSIKNAQPHQ